LLLVEEDDRVRRKAFASESPSFFAWATDFSSA
jgi:hypothetical protein